MNISVLVAVSVFLAIACWTDLRTMHISNKLVLLFACSGLLYQMLSYGALHGIEFALMGALAGFVPLYLLFLLRGLGGGDVKWFGAFGMWTGVLPTLQLMIYSLLCAGGIALFVLFFRLPWLRELAMRVKWPWGSHPTTSGRAAHFPFMLAVAPSFMILIAKG
ncbi:MAG: prepilin peptidase [Candidatus Cohnella colombiensis]|uniref:Prepilin peptidase n=1 Tax=Candidatus Cohnella colombiensis TaxID=3121368 RepID=A0AA95JB40_9BACL|nr:MAG: prepilin peptidase [Cohnella sp.]